jgi:hypothetical protein
VGLRTQKRKRERAGDKKPWDKWRQQSIMESLILAQDER